MDIKYFYSSRPFKVILTLICLLIVFLAIFEAGKYVGYRKAMFSYGFADRYHQTFGDMRHGMMGFSRDDLSSGHGAAGKIIRVSLPTIVLATQDNIEKSILINDKTLIRRFRDQIQAADLRVDDIAIILGEPNNDGQIVAKFIRIMPALPGASTGSSSSTRAASGSGASTTTSTR